MRKRNGRIFAKNCPVRCGSCNFTSLGCILVWVIADARRIGLGTGTSVTFAMLSLLGTVSPSRSIWCSANDGLNAATAWPANAEW